MQSYTKKNTQYKTTLKSTSQMYAFQIKASHADHMTGDYNQ